MPLYAGALKLIRTNLEEIHKGNKSRGVVAIGTLTEVQLEAINTYRAAYGDPPMVAEILFLGRHVHKSRVIQDGYTIDDVIDQIASAMEETSLVLNGRGMTAMQNPTPRPDRYGNLVQDKIVFECSGRHPKPELFSVMPRGDHKKPKGPFTE